MLDALRRALTRLGEFTTHPMAFAVVVGFSVAWLIFSPETFGWAAIGTLATRLMTLFINRTGYRDTQALRAKLDEEALDRFSAARLRADRRIGRTLSLSRRWPWQLADRRQVERWPVTARVFALRRHELGLRRPHREMAQHFRSPHLDRSEGKGCDELQSKRLHCLGRTDKDQWFRSGWLVVWSDARDGSGGRRRARGAKDPVRH